MRKLALAIGCILALAAPALALPGPDPAGVPSEFSITFEELGSSPVLRYDTLMFARADGWDFGDREGYQCAWVERFAPDGTLLFRVEIEQNEFYPADPGFRINDRGGVEDEGPSTKPPVGTPDGCGAGAGEGSWEPDGEDHFPHHTHQHLYVSGIEDPTAFLDLHRDDCARGYWTPGDEPGEAILWWDVDGPTHDGHGELPCNGGPMEPLAAARMLVIPVAANTGVCTHDDLDGSRCVGVTTPVPSPSPCVVNPKTGTCKPPKG